MAIKSLRWFVIVVAAGTTVALSSAQALAQFSGGAAGQPNLPPGARGPMIMPNAGMMPGAAQISPQQLQGMMMMRALQGRGSHQVRTGIPNPVQMGPGPMMGNPYGAAYPQQQRQAGTATTKVSSSQKRLEARKLRDEQKRSAKEAAKNKKAGGDKPAKASKKAKDADAQAAS